MKIISYIKNLLRSLYSTDENTVKFETEENDDVVEESKVDEQKEENIIEPSDEGIGCEKDEDVHTEVEQHKTEEKKNTERKTQKQTKPKQKKQKGTLKLKNGIETIEKNKYRNNKDLVEVFIPSSVTKIERGAFFGCNSLRRVVFHNNLQAIPEIEQEVFCDKVENKLVNLENLETIEVPEKFVEQMKKMKGWNRYSKLIKKLESEK